MANKHKKKRNKAYTGAGAAKTQPTITRVTAVKRSKVGQWWFDNKKRAKPILIATVVVLIIVWLIFEVIRIATS